MYPLFLKPCNLFYSNLFQLVFNFFQVAWGMTSMVEAERRLLANALLDPDNQHFVLLSDRYFCCLILLFAVNSKVCLWD